MVGRQPDRQTYVQKDGYTYVKYIYRHTKVKTYRQTQTNRQCRSAGKQADKQTYIKKDECSNIHTYAIYRQTDKQT